MPGGVPGAPRSGMGVDGGSQDENMPDPAVEKWRLNGCAHLWRYVNPGSGMRGWHFNADEFACVSISDLVDRMLASPWKSSKRFPISVPAVMTVNPGVQVYVLDADGRVAAYIGPPGMVRRVARAGRMSLTP